LRRILSELGFAVSNDSRKMGQISSNRLSMSSAGAENGSRLVVVSAAHSDKRLMCSVKQADRGPQHRAIFSSSRTARAMAMRRRGPGLCAAPRHTTRASAGSSTLLASCLPSAERTKGRGEHSGDQPVTLRAV
jgi:hypothetical protein